MANDRLTLIDAASTRASEDDTGQHRRPYRPVPRDFVELWPSHGWSSGKEHWRCHSRTLERWVDECGREEMIMARKAYLEAQRSVQGRARRSRYVMGRTMTPVGDMITVADTASADKAKECPTNKGNSMASNRYPHHDTHTQ